MIRDKGFGGSEPVCSLCGKSSSKAHQAAPTPSLDGGQEQLASQLCPRCGAILSKTEEAKLRKRSQLARFGLNDDGEPLLKPKKRGKSTGRTG
jgi:hypothetical protein